MSDQTAKSDAGKIRLTLVPPELLEAVAVVREYGNLKYHDSDNWKTVEVERYKDAMFRHFVAYLQEPYGVDAESNLPHLYHVACNVAFLVALEMESDTIPRAEDAMERMNRPMEETPKNTGITFSEPYLGHPQCFSCTWGGRPNYEYPCNVCSSQNSKWELRYGL